MPAIFGPRDVLFKGLVVRELTRRTWTRRLGEFDEIDFVFFQGLGALRYRTGNESQPTTVGGCLEMVNSPGCARDGLGAERYVRVFLRIRGIFRRTGCMVLQGARQIEGIDGVATLGCAVLNGVFPDFLVRVLLILAPRRTRGKVDCF